jgi:putative restriction endonuclease
MRLYVGLTDYEWFDFLARQQPDEVNFWMPKPRAFRALQPGELFLFKLHAPHKAIVGGGFFVTYSALPLSLAWQAFGTKNGVPSAEGLREAIGRYRDITHEVDPVIGCLILAQPFFFSEPDWIAAPADWHPAIQQGKTYYMDEPVGRTLWEQVQKRLSQVPSLASLTEPRPTPEIPSGYGSPAWVRPRLGQGAFRVLVTDAYQRRCALTQERTLPVLQAAHIKPHARSGPHEIRNGLLLRADLHILFDRGYLTVTPDLHVEVSRRIKEDYENGREYYTLHGRSLAALPQNPADRPAREFLEWHNQHVFLG